jgi:putative hydrolase of the HAD superfamily
LHNSTFEKSLIDVRYWNESPLNNLFDYTIFSYEVGCLKFQNEIYEILIKKIIEKNITKKCTL